ncbi:MAG: UbiD family decarboxylase domain-containing protein [Actinomycetota bacterium]
MNLRPALSLRDALAAVRQDASHSYHVCAEPLSRTEVADDFAVRFAGIPANSLARSEDVALYTNVSETGIPVVLGLYGDAERVRGWLPGLPRHTNRESVAGLLATLRRPEPVERPACRESLKTSDVDLEVLPALRATPRDAGPYLTMGMMYACEELPGALALSVHRMLVLDRTRLAIWMVPGRQLQAMHQAAIERGARLPVSINIGVPPAAMIASALNTRFLPGKATKLEVAGALAGAPIAVAPALSQPTSVLAESEIVLEGFLDDNVADECLCGTPGTSLPEFLGYDGAARAGLPVLTVTAITMRRSCGRVGRPT